MYRNVTDPSGAQLAVRTNAELERALGMDLPEQRSVAWHAMRRDFITGSAIDTVLGTNPYEPPLKLMLIKAGKPDHFAGNAATAHGTRYEDVACALYEAKHKRRVMHVGLVPHPTHELLAHSPDGLSFDLCGGAPHLLEIKCPTSKSRAHDAARGKVPPYYVHQLQMGMSTFNLEAADFVQYVPAGIQGLEDDVMTLTRVLRDPDWLEKHDRTIRAFWDDVLLWRARGWHTHPSEACAI